MSNNSDLYVDYEELERLEDLRMTYKGNLFTGVAYEKYWNGQLAHEVAFVDGVENGQSVDYFESGQIKAQEQVRIGALHGLCHYWYESGQLKSEKVYEYNILVREHRWDEDGSLITNYQINESHPMYESLLIQRSNPALYPPSEQT